MTFQPEAFQMLRLLIAISLAGAGAAGAQTMTGAVTTSMVRTGWNSDSFAVVTAAPIINPAGCRTPDGYISEKSLPGYDTYLAAALTAFSLNVPVVIAVHNSQCFADRPVMIGINLAR